MKQCGFHWNKAPITRFPRSLFGDLVADSDQLLLPVDIFPPQDLVLGVFSDQFTAPEAGETRHSKKRDQFGHEAGEEKLEGYAHGHCACSGSGHTPLRADSLFAEVDMLDEHDLAVIVFDDVVAAEPIAVLIEIVGALDARVALDAQDRLADLLRLKTLSVIDHER